MKTLSTMIILSCLMTLGYWCKSQNPVKGKSVITSEPLKESNFGQIENKAQSGGLADNRELKGIPGSPYLFDTWYDGVITMKDKSRIEGKQYRYNLYTQQMQFVNGPDTVAIGNPKDIAKIQFGGRTFVYTSFSNQGKPDQGYFEQICEGNCRLLKRYVVLYHLVDNENSGIQNETGKDTPFLRDCNCFLQFGTEPTQQIGRNKKEFLSLFTKDKDKVAGFIKQKDVKLKNEEDLKAVVDFYNQLQK